ncbi:MAG: hypothetical protein Q4Q53_01275 [Methanocorpusculum sp.]|nr:hypothetical protein [Methanocorpusculum sp.]
MTAKKIIIVIILFIVSAICTAGCINTQENETENQDYFMPSMFDRGFIEYPPNVTSGSHALEWRFDIENSTGFVNVSIRDDTTSRIPRYVASPDTDSRIAIKITANNQDITVFLNRTRPISDGMSLYLENEPIHVKTGETADAYLILKIEPSALNTASHTIVKLDTTDGWSRSRVCQIYSDKDTNRPDIHRTEQN